MQRLAVVLLGALMVAFAISGTPDLSHANHPYGFGTGSYTKLAANSWYNYYAGRAPNNITFKVCGLPDPDTVVWALWQGWTLNSNHRYNVQYIADCNYGTNLYVAGVSDINYFCGEPPPGLVIWGCWDSFCDPAGPPGNWGNICQWDPAHYGGVNTNYLGIIFVNAGVWSSPGFVGYTKTYLSNHEFGHSNGLDDHAFFECLPGTVMSRGTQSTGCYPQYPTAGDFGTVNCVYY